MAVEFYMDGRWFSSYAEAARFYGVGYKTIRRAVERGATTFVKHAGIKCETEIDGVRYRSQKEAAAAIGITPTALYHRLARGSFTIEGKLRSDAGRRRARRMKTEDTKVFSITEAQLREIVDMEPGDEREAAIAAVLADPVQANVSNATPHNKGAVA